MYQNHRRVCVRACVLQEGSARRISRATVPVFRRFSRRKEYRRIWKPRPSVRPSITEYQRLTSVGFPCSSVEQFCTKTVLKARILWKSAQFSLRQAVNWFLSALATCHLLWVKFGAWDVAPLNFRTFRENGRSENRTFRLGVTEVSLPVHDIWK